MGKRPRWATADFYVGRGENAEYVGSGHAPSDGYGIASFWPDRLLDLDDYSEDDFRDWVTAMAGNVEEQSDEKPQWPHAHADSTDTEWAYCYDTGSVYVYRLGVEMAIVRCNYRRWVPAADDRNVQEFAPRRTAKFPTLAPEGQPR